ncbi:MAG: UTP--glucose-1-phosphate uridylyltransferase GalU [Actinobacteria bacterium]|nr:UTP--glucose-1-phosphate uridylyltransferase GalU [Actinomycetota bacterium]
MSVRKAVIPAAGLGTRFLPATKSQPKEMIPVIDKPMIQYVVEEAVRAGLDDILIVSSRGKSAMEDHFDRSLELEHHLEETGKSSLLAEVRNIAELANIHFVRQKEPLGFGHAVSVARAHTGGEPFAVLVGDEVVPAPQEGEPALMENLVDIYEKHDASVIAVQEVSPQYISAYGVIDAEEFEDGLVKVLDMIEKPPANEAASNLGSRGRYVFAPDIYEALDRTTKGHGDEIQLTDAIRLLARWRSVYAYIHRGPMFDVGKKLDYLKATIELALRRDDLGKPMRDYIAQVATRLA